MLEFLKDYNGGIKINGVMVDKSELDKYENPDGDLEIHLSQKFITNKDLIKIEVVDWMLESSDVNRSFHLRWNRGIGMPERIMFGKIIEETGSTYKMQLSTMNKSKYWTGYVAKVAITKMEDYDE